MKLFLAGLMALGWLATGSLRAFGPDESGPLIAIESPDKGTTFSVATIKDRCLFWNKRTGQLSARVTFTDAAVSNGTPSYDTHFFRFPGVTFDPQKNLFYAPSPQGELIPIATIKKTLFIKSVAVLPNAHVRIIRFRGDVSAVFEAIRPGDARLTPKPAANPDETHGIDLQKLF